MSLRYLFGYHDREGLSYVVLMSLYFIVEIWDVGFLTWLNLS
jgi:hypothetical protein